MLTHITGSVVDWSRLSYDQFTPALISALADALPTNTRVRSLHFPSLDGYWENDGKWREHFRDFSSPDFDAALERLGTVVMLSAIESIVFPRGWQRPPMRAKREEIYRCIRAGCFRNRMSQDLRRIVENDPSMTELFWAQGSDSLAIAALAVALRSNTHLYRLHLDSEIDIQTETRLALAFSHSGVCICTSSSHSLFRVAATELILSQPLTKPLSTRREASGGQS